MYTIDNRARELPNFSKLNEFIYYEFIYYRFIYSKFIYFYEFCLVFH